MILLVRLAISNNYHFFLFHCGVMLTLPHVFVAISLVEWTSNRSLPDRHWHLSCQVHWLNIRYISRSTSHKHEQSFFSQLRCGVMLTLPHVFVSIPLVERTSKGSLPERHWHLSCQVMTLSCYRSLPPSIDWRFSNLFHLNKESKCLLHQVWVWIELNWNTVNVWKLWQNNWNKWKQSSFTSRPIFRKSMIDKSCSKKIKHELHDDNHFYEYATQINIDTCIIFMKAIHTWKLIKKWIIAQSSWMVAEVATDRQ